MEPAEDVVTPYEFPELDTRYPVPVTYDGHTYPSAENAFQASRFSSCAARKKLSRSMPNTAARIGAASKYAIPDDSEQALIGMCSIMLSKFGRGSLKEALLSTKGRRIVMANTRHDVLWGVCICSKCCGKGQNRLGRVLEQIRDEIL